MISLHLLPLTQAVRDVTNAGYAPLDVLRVVASELQPTALGAEDVARTVVGAIGSERVARRLGLVWHEPARWISACMPCYGAARPWCPECRGTGTRFATPPEHAPALRALALELAAGMLAAASEGARP